MRPSVKKLLESESIPCILNLIQIYASITTANDETIEEFYKTIEEKLKEMPKKEIAIIIR